MKSKKLINFTVLSAVFIISALLISCLAGCTKNSSQNNLSTKENIFNIGSYNIQIDDSILVQEGAEGDESIEFSGNNTFNAYLGFGNSISGSYTISNNEINCIADTFYSEYGPNQKITASLTFKINSDSEIEIINTSEKYEIKVVDILNNSLTDETKDMSFWPYVAGIKFNLSK